MAVLELNPLPPGSYWVDVPAADVSRFGAWTGTNTTAGVLRVAATHTYPNGGVWVRFDVFTPGVHWEGPGVPNLAGPHDLTPDTAHGPAPDAPTTFQRVEQTLEHGLETIDVVALVILALAVMKHFDRR